MTNIQQALPPQLRRLLPFLIIAIAVVSLTQYQKGGALAPPQMKLLSQATRSADNTNFTLPDLSDRPRQLENFKGNVVLLNFFATWCGPCRKEMPTLEALYQTYKDRDFIVLGIAGDTQGTKTVAPFVQDYNLSFPILLDPQGGISTQYRVPGVPTIYLLDRRGRVAGMTVGSADWNSDQARALIETLLEEE